MKKKFGADYDQFFMFSWAKNKLNFVLFCFEAISSSFSSPFLLAAVKYIKFQCKYIKDGNKHMFSNLWFSG